MEIMLWFSYLKTLQALICLTVKYVFLEEAWNLGASVSTYIPVFGKTLNVNAEYYYTDFLKQVVVDMDTDPHEIAFYNLNGRSYSHVFQVEANYPLF